MTIGKKLTKLIRRRFYRHLQGAPNHGIDLRRDIETSLPWFKPDVIFDVGANMGQSAKQFRKWFPNATIHCFEPSSSTFDRLEKSLKDIGKTHCHKLALGASPRLGYMTTEEDSDRHRLLEGEADSNLVTKWLQSTQVETVDSFCDSRRIARMSLLKIDTEGGDLDVLKGSERMLSEQRIDAVQVEAGMNPMNERHIPFEVLKRYLEERGYFLFGIYEQIPEWPSFEPHLRRSNPVFISKSLIKRNTL